MHQKKNTISKIILIFNVLILIAVCVWVVISSGNMQKNDLSIDDWKSDFAVYRDQIIYKTENKVNDSGKVCCPYLMHERFYP